MDQFNSCIARRTRARKDALIKEKHNELVGQGIFSPSRAKHNHNFAGLGEASVVVIDDEEEDSKNGSRRKHGQLKGLGDASVNVIEDDEEDYSSDSDDVMAFADSDSPNEAAVKTRTVPFKPRTRGKGVIHSQLTSQPNSQHSKKNHSLVEIDPMNSSSSKYSEESMGN